MNNEKMQALILVFCLSVLVTYGTFNIHRLYNNVLNERFFMRVQVAGVLDKELRKQL